MWYVILLVGKSGLRESNLPLLGIKGIETTWKIVAKETIVPWNFIIIQHTLSLWEDTVSVYPCF